MNKWLIAHRIFLPKKMSTAYEWQIGRLSGRWVHLKGNYWSSWFMTERFSFFWTDKYGNHKRIGNE